MPKEFHIGDILTVTIDRMLSPRGVEGLYDILSFMSGAEVYTHQIPRIAKEAAPVLLHQHPQLAAIKGADITKDNYRAKLAGYITQFGEMLPVTPMTENEHEYRDPISELAEKVHPSKIIVVKV
jgi:hypothetical protein